MEGQAEPGGGQACHQKADEDNLSRVELVEEVAHDWLSNSIHEPANAGRDGYAGAGKFKVFAHGDYENPEPVARAGGHSRDEHSGQYHVPAVVNALPPRQSRDRAALGCLICLEPFLSLMADPLVDLDAVAATVYHQHVAFAVQLDRRRPPEELLDVGRLLPVAHRVETGGRLQHWREVGRDSQGALLGVGLEVLVGPRKAFQTRPATWTAVSPLEDSTRTRSLPQSAT